MKRQLVRGGMAVWAESPEVDLGLVNDEPVIIGGLKAWRKTYRAGDVLDATA